MQFGGTSRFFLFDGTSRLQDVSGGFGCYLEGMRFTFISIVDGTSGHLEPAPTLRARVFFLVFFTAYIVYIYIYTYRSGPQWMFD